MALFSRKDTKKEEGQVQANAAPAAKGRSIRLADALLTPRITEKATLLQLDGAYVFNITPRATKREVADAVRRAYGVIPRAVRIISVVAKKTRNMRSGKMGVKRGGRKAYVYLKKGDSITLT